METYPKQPAIELEPNPDPNTPRTWEWTIDIIDRDDDGPTSTPFYSPFDNSMVNQTFFAGLVPIGWQLKFWDKDHEQWCLVSYLKMSNNFAWDPDKFPPAPIQASPAPEGWIISRNDYPYGWWTLSYPHGAIKPIFTHPRIFPDTMTLLPRIGANTYKNPWGEGYWWFPDGPPINQDGSFMDLYLQVDAVQYNYYCSIDKIVTPFVSLLPSLTIMAMIGTMLLTAAPTTRQPRTNQLIS